MASRFMRLFRNGLSVFLYLLASYMTSGVAAEAKESAFEKKQPIIYQFAIYFLTNAPSDPVPVFGKLLGEDYMQWKLITKKPEQIDVQMVKAYWETNVPKAYTPPDLNGLQYTGRGLSKEQALALQKSPQALLLDFACPHTNAELAMLDALVMTHKMAQKTGGLLWDEETREVFSIEAWEERRIKGWQKNLPNIPKQITIHAYRKGELFRAITLGMAKFGLPDLVVEDFTSSSMRNVGILVNCFAQSLVEGSPAEIGKTARLDLKNIRHTEVRDPQIKTLFENATGKANLLIKKGKWEDGDPENRLFELGFDLYAGKAVQERQEKLLGEVFGWKDPQVVVKHNEAIIAASKRAREKLPELAAIVRKGLAPSERISVKAPFKVPTGGNEYMWVEVLSWNGDKIVGILDNEPFNIPTLHSGQRVTVREQDVFDYIHVLPDGSPTGNSTGKLIERYEESK